MFRLKWTPRQWLELSAREQAVVLAGIEMKMDEEKKQNDEMERKANQAKR